MIKFKHPLFFFAALLMLTVSGNAQQQFSGWAGSFNTFKLNNRFSLHFDAQLRSTNDLENVGAILLRPGLNYHLNKNLVFTAGYLLNSSRRTVGTASSLLSEHRIWQQALVNQKVSKVALAHRFRFEERFIPKAKISGDELATDGYDQVFRFRYFIRGILPLVPGTTFSSGPFAALQNEVFLNTGNTTAVNGKAFDQNRLYGAVGYRFQGKMDIEIGYMNQYSNTRTAFVNNHILQLAVYKRL
ncbi:DUF2490 domain-containing protein [Flavisolibacter sp. BT320]|nr:DUF2490 domain-containing protein [Flavisolibacter longurius]